MVVRFSLSKATNAPSVRFSGTEKEVKVDIVKIVDKHLNK